MKEGQGIKEREFAIGGRGRSRKGKVEEGEKLRKDPKGEGQGWRAAAGPHRREESHGRRNLKKDREWRKRKVNRGRSRKDTKGK